jgi:hypothetical protein
MAKPSKEKLPESIFKARLKVHSQQSATILRTDLPSITDKTESAVLWLAKNNFKPEEIEVIGEKPSSWNIAFNIIEPEPIKQVEASVTPEVKPVEIPHIADPANIEAVTETITPIPNVESPEPVEQTQIQS